MDESKSSISQARSYREMGDFWDTHDVTEYWEQTEEADFEVSIESQVFLCSLEPRLAMQVSQLAHQKGVSMETLVNLWIQEKLNKELAEMPVTF